ncbi:NTP transferase domain-containing protein [Nakamurella sp. YIM 132087]|uniref:NTP transferase domain-containing protein n=1 Tax=Nakamurella alba TaxID=2665158 RepID=A0A7K1FJ23_9ACTN|nr:NDP-sugar synthase [Nakamurella alba]MTD14117.1 NTP transferase domain-containing protein [Nakamurella alba]
MAVPSGPPAPPATATDGTDGAASTPGTDEVQAAILVGGQGTRLRPLTLSAAKPMLPTAGVPFLEHMLSRIKEAGITKVVLGTSYKAETFTEYFGDGSAMGMSITYAVEESPMGTGGAIRNVLSELTAPTVMVFNGDVLSGLDLRAILDTHRSRNADVTLHLVQVPDPRAFGCVPTDPDGRVEAFLEKTENPPTNQINAGCYVFRREVIESIPDDRPVSVERETFPGLLAAGAPVYGHVDATYWRDLGTPAAFVAGSADLVTGLAPTGALPGEIGDALVLPGAAVAPTARISGGSTIGRDVVVGEDAVVDGSVVFDGAVIGAGAVIARSVIGAGATIGAGTDLADTVIGDRAQLGAGCELRAGARVWPDAVIADGAVRFSAPA